MLQSRAIRTARGEQDGLRISIMSRHTLSDGITHDHTIAAHMYDGWLPELAPSPKLIGDYYKRGLSWSDFETQFNEYLDTDRAQRSLRSLALLAMQDNVTVLCTEATPDLCHRRLVLERCQLLVPEVTIHIQ